MRYWTPTIGWAVGVTMAAGAVFSVCLLTSLSGPVKPLELVLMPLVIILALGGCGYAGGMVWDYKTGFETRRYSGREYGLGVLAGAGACAACWLLLGIVMHVVAP